MRGPFFDPDTQSWNQPLDTMQDIARDVAHTLIADREGKLREHISTAVEQSVLDELRGEYREELTEQQIKIIAHSVAVRAIAALSKPAI